MDFTEAARDQRERFADVVEGLGRADWNAQSLCSEWRVRDVVAHVIGYLDRIPLMLLPGLLSVGGRLDRLNARDVHTRSGNGLEELVRELRDGAEPTGMGACLGGRVGLVECVVHQLDITRPLGMTSSLSMDRLRACLGFAYWSPVIRGGIRCRGVRLVATDTDWESGRGAPLYASAEALLLVIAGRPVPPVEITGPGASLLWRHAAEDRAWRAPRRGPI